jgi:DNA-directed RNA polymerase subunit M/transcription elongation factor TFIIS
MRASSHSRSPRPRGIVLTKVLADDFYGKWNKYELAHMHRFAEPYCFIKCDLCGSLEECGSYQLAAKRYCGDCKKAVEAILPTVRRAIRGMRLPPASIYTCIDCGEKAGVWEHRRYDRPHEVVATCYTCNKLRGPASFFLPDVPNSSPILTTQPEAIDCACNSFFPPVSAMRWPFAPEPNPSGVFSSQR